MIKPKPVGADKPPRTFAHAMGVYLGVFASEIVVYALTAGIIGRFAGEHLPGLIRSGAVDIAALSTAYQAMVPLSFALTAIAAFALVLVCVTDDFVLRRIDVPTAINMAAAAMFSLCDLIAYLFGIVPGFPPVAGVAIAAVAGTAVGFCFAVKKALE